MKSYIHVTTLLDIIAMKELPTFLRYWQGLVQSNEKIILANYVPDSITSVLERKHEVKIDTNWQKREVHTVSCKERR